MTDYLRVIYMTVIYSSIKMPIAPISLVALSHGRSAVQERKGKFNERLVHEGTNIIKGYNNQCVITTWDHNVEFSVRIVQELL